MVAETSATAYTDFGALTQLKARAGTNDPQAVREAARQFEALFLQMMLKSMRDAGNVLSESRDRTYEEMFDQQIALDLAQRDSLGIGDLLLRQIDSLQTDDSSGDGAHLPLPNQIAVSNPAALSSRQRSDFRPADARAFVQEIWGLAQETGAELGIDPRAIVAQAALETGWGNKLIRDASGVSSNNLFGIKADDRWNGERISVSTLEYEGDRFIPQQAQFRAYRDLNEGFRGYQEFLATNTRYAEAVRHGADGRSFAQELQAAGYATDPDYAAKLERILDSGQLEAYISHADGR